MAPADQTMLYWFPLIFVGMWLLITTILGVFSGWFELQRHYQPSDEPALVTLRRRSGSMGFGVGLNGILTLSACASGLRVGIWRIFGPFQRPFLVPWHEIEAKQTTRFFVPRSILTFGKPAVGVLRISARTWQRLAQTSHNAPGNGEPPVTRVQAGRGLLVQWLVISVIAGCFFYFVSRSNPGNTELPIVACFGLPGLVFGLAIGFAFLRDEW